MRVNGCYKLIIRDSRSGSPASDSRHRGSPPDTGAATRVRIAALIPWARVNEVAVSARVESPRPQVAVTIDCAATVVRSPSEDARASQRASIDSMVADEEPVGARPKAK